MSKGTIHYGFGADYLPQWGIKEALREIYQNFIDYGDFQEESFQTGDLHNIKLTSAWAPDSLEYLRIGNSQKDNPNAIGHHGEGLKMAFLILLREEYSATIFTNKYAVTPEWYMDPEIGECFCFEYETHDFTDAPYTVEFCCPTQDYLDFYNNIVRDENVVYSDAYYGDIVDKDKGNIYSGRLWVAKLDGISRAYNIHPRHLPLDRDRCVPKAFDVNYATSKILEASKKVEISDFAHSDTMYMDNLPDHVVESFKPVKVGNSIEFTYKDANKKTVVLSNPRIKDVLKKHSLFQTAIQKLKRFLAKQLGLYDLLVEFKTKHSLYGEALQDFNLILERVNK